MINKDDKNAKELEKFINVRIFVGSLFAFFTPLLILATIYFDWGSIIVWALMGVTFGGAIVAYLSTTNLKEAIVDDNSQLGKGLRFDATFPYAFKLAIFGNIISLVCLAAFYGPFLTITYACTIALRIHGHRMARIWVKYALKNEIEYTIK